MKTVAEETVWKVKRILEIKPDGRVHAVLSTRQIQVGPTLVRDVDPDENPTPSEERPNVERQEIGSWRRMMSTVRRYGLP